MYWNTRRKPNWSGARSAASHCARLSSMVASPADPAAGSARVASPRTTRSMRMKREPLTRMRRGRRRLWQRGEQRAASSKWRARAEGLGRMGASRRPSRRARCRARARASPTSAWNCRPLVADLAHVARAPASAGAGSRPARRWRRAPNRGWRCSCRRPASRARPAIVQRQRCERPLDRLRTPASPRRRRPAARRRQARRPPRRARCARCAARRMAQRAARLPAGVRNVSAQAPSPCQAPAR